MNRYARLLDQMWNEACTYTLVSSQKGRHNYPGQQTWTLCDPQTERLLSQVLYNCKQNSFWRHETAYHNATGFQSLPTHPKLGLSSNTCRQYKTHFILRQHTTWHVFVKYSHAFGYWVLMYKPEWVSHQGTHVQSTKQTTNCRTWQKYEQAIFLHSGV